MIYVGIRESVDFFGIRAAVDPRVGIRDSVHGCLKVFHTIYIYLLCFVEPTSECGCDPTAARIRFPFNRGLNSKFPRGGLRNRKDGGSNQSCPPA